MRFTELEVWQEAMELVIDVYHLTAELPPHERYGLRQQIRRAAVSVPSNIAEGEGRRGRRDHSRFLLNARGSLYELQTQMIICERLGYVDRKATPLVASKMETVGRLINGTLRYLARAANRDHRAPSADRRAPTARCPSPE